MRFKLFVVSFRDYLVSHFIYISIYLVSSIEELGKLGIPSYFVSTLGESYLPARVRGRFRRNHSESG